MDIIKKQLSTTDKNGNEKAIHLETSAELVKMTGFYTLSSLSGLITDTDNALQALKKLQTNISNIKVFSGTDGSNAGTSGLVTAPSILDKDKFLKSDGTWSKVSAAETANQLSSPVNLQVNLSSAESSSFNGSQDTAIGVTGTLPISSGGTGATSLDNITVGKANQLHYTECSSESNVAEKSVDCTNFVLEKGVRVSVLFTITNTAKNPTLNVNSTGAKPIYYRGYPIPASAIQANSLYDLIYNGSQWLIVGSVLWTE